jgi:DNA-binding transcriptional MerR regulator
MNQMSFNIAAVERDTGLSKDVLRMWERRYGFPVPERDSNGERSYPAAQVERLRLIKRLMDQGHRPGKLIATNPDELGALAPRRVVAPMHGGDSIDSSDLEELLALIKKHDASGYQQAMQQRLARQGMQRFVQYTVAPLTRRVGESWEDGSFEVFEEHLFTELTKRLLRQAIATPARQPRWATHHPDQRTGRTACNRPLDGRGAFYAGRCRLHTAGYANAATGDCSSSQRPPRRYSRPVVLGCLPATADSRPPAAVAPGVAT